MRADIEPLVSIIVPVYNCELYLKRCLKSISNQEYKNIEIILVDDGSMDSSGGVCDRFAVEDSRTQVIHLANRGVSNARNIGIERAKGEFISFVDSDDVISKFFVSELISCCIDSNADIAMCDFISFCSETNTCDLFKECSSDIEMFNSEALLYGLCYAKIHQIIWISHLFGGSCIKPNI